MEKSLDFIKTPGLKDIPLKVMQVYEYPSTSIIEKISKLDDEVVSILPESYKQIIWENNLDRFEKHIFKYITAYVEDYVSITRNTEISMINLSQTQKNFPRDRRRNNRNLYFFMLILSFLE